MTVPWNPMECCPDGLDGRLDFSPDPPPCLDLNGLPRFRAFRGVLEMHMAPALESLEEAWNVSPCLGRCDGQFWAVLVESDQPPFGSQL